MSMRMAMIKLVTEQDATSGMTASGMAASGPHGGELDGGEYEGNAENEDE
jgi:hypothetical protein